MLAAVSAKAKKAFRKVARLVKRLAPPEMRAAPSEMIRRVMDGFYADYLVARYPNARLRREDISQLALYAAQYDSAHAFLAELALSGVVEAETSPVGPDEDKFVTLSTVHQAKGLEWPVVFVIWLADGRFPTDFAGRVEGGYEEERRLFHVAVTRAKDELVLAYPMTYRWRGKAPVLMKRSRFLVELDEPSPPPYDIVVIEEPAPTDFELMDRAPAAGKARRIEVEAEGAPRALPGPEKKPKTKRKTKRKKKPEKKPEKKAGRKAGKKPADASKKAGKGARKGARKKKRGT